VAIRLGAVLALALTFPLAFAARAAPPPDGFAAFWPVFKAAVAKDDAKALGAMTALGPGLGDDSPTFAQFHAKHLGAAARRCLAAAKPNRDVDGNGQVNYGVFCGEIIYVFSKRADAWKLTDLGAND
jgi:hypothetical protein